MPEDPTQRPNEQQPLTNGWRGKSDRTSTKARTSCPVLVNTTFNVRGEPIVCTPEDAFWWFMGTDIEVLAAGNCFLRKEEQASELSRNYKTGFALD